MRKRIAASVTLFVLFPAQVLAQDGCAVLHQVVQAAASGFEATKGAPTQITGRDVWRSRVTLPYTSACIVDPAGAYHGSPPTFDCFLLDVAQLDRAILGCFPAATRNVTRDAISFDLGGVTIILDGFGRALRILAE